MGISVASTPSAACIVGGPASGKTTLIVKRACELSGGLSSVEGDSQLGRSSVLVLCASSVSAKVMQDSLNGAGCHDVEVGTPIGLASSLLEDASVVARHGRLHVLDPFEESILFEDVKTCGCKRGRLRDLMSFLERGSSDMLDDDPDWIKTAEERLVLDLIRDCLGFTGGVLRSQAASVAVRELLADGNLLSRHSFEHVLVDDYDLMGRSSQIMANMLAMRSIVVSAGRKATLAVGDPYPNASGIEEFMEANPHAERSVLSERHRNGSIRAILARLEDELGEAQTDGLWAEGLDGRCINGDVELHGGSLAGEPRSGERCGSVDVFMEDGIQAECVRVARLVRDSIDSGVPARRVLVVGSNGAWRANVRRALESVGVPTRSSVAHSKRIRFESCGDKMRTEQRVQALFRIARDEDDSLAWRTLCGLDDAIANSAAMSSLRVTCALFGLRLAEALRLLDAGNLECASSDDPRYASLLAAYRDAMNRVRDLGSLDAFGDSGETQQRAPLSEAASSADSVLVGAPSDAFAFEADLVVFGGFVNGLIPSRDYFDPAAMVGSSRVRARRRDLESLAQVVSCAKGRLVFTGFTSCGLEVAERLKLRISRIRLKDGVRVATIEPSELLGVMGLLGR